MLAARGMVVVGTSTCALARASVRAATTIMRFSAKTRVPVVAIAISSGWTTGAFLLWLWYVHWSELGR